MPGKVLNGRIHRINVSDGGVPKHAVESAEVGDTGLVGDRQRDLRHHGGPERAVSVLGLDVIQRLRAAGHPIQPGAAGENLTLEGIEWSRVALGSRLQFEGGAELEAVSHAVPCSNIKACFREGDITQLAQKVHPGSARIYTRVLSPGRFTAGEGCAIVLPD